ncbi:MAG: hypothetical protein OXH06_03645 [Gemmatimonadetes bacterium]|nr:hypothetical protein [Gemmatimonadota bacterium]
MSHLLSLCLITLIASPIVAEERHYIPTTPVDSLDFLTPYLAKKPAREGPPKGNIINYFGTPCSFYQVRTKDTAPSYFYERLTGDVNILAFDDKECMNSSEEDTPHSPFMGINQRLINQAIARWYNKHDRPFQVEIKDLTPAGQTSAGKQIRGWCITSKNPTGSIMVDYISEGNSLAFVIHGIGLGCAEAE